MKIDLMNKIKAIASSIGRAFFRLFEKTPTQAMASKRERFFYDRGWEAGYLAALRMYGSDRHITFVHLENCFQLSEYPDFIEF